MLVKSYFIKSEKRYTFLSTLNQSTIPNHCIDSPNNSISTFKGINDILIESHFPSVYSKVLAPEPTVESTVAGR